MVVWSLLLTQSKWSYPRRGHDSPLFKGQKETVGCWGSNVVFCGILAAADSCGNRPKMLVPPGMRVLSGASVKSPLGS